MKPLPEIKNIISSACSEYPAVMAAFIFGSLAKGNKEHPKDIDVAVLLDYKESDVFPLLTFISDLEESLQYPTDVVVLNRAPELLKYHVRRDGILIFDRCPEFRKKFEIRSRKSYEDFLYLHSRYVKKVLYGEN